MVNHILRWWGAYCRYVFNKEANILIVYACIPVILPGVPFPRNFITIAKTILKRLFRVYAHIYHAHFDDVITLQEEAHLNTSFKHFIYFVHEFSLIEKRELSPMQELIDRMMKWTEGRQSWCTVLHNNIVIIQVNVHYTPSDMFVISFCTVHYYCFIL